MSSREVGHVAADLDARVRRAAARRPRGSRARTRRRRRSARRARRRRSAPRRAARSAGPCAARAGPANSAVSGRPTGRGASAGRKRATSVPFWWTATFAAGTPRSTNVARENSDWQRITSAASYSASSWRRRRASNVWLWPGGGAMPRSSHSRDDRVEGVAGVRVRRLAHRADAERARRARRVQRRARPDVDDVELAGVPAQRPRDAQVVVAVGAVAAERAVRHAHPGGLQRRDDAAGARQLAVEARAPDADLDALRRAGPRPGGGRSCRSRGRRVRRGSCRGRASVRSPRSRRASAGAGLRPLRLGGLRPGALRAGAPLPLPLPLPLARGRRRSAAASTDGAAGAFARRTAGIVLPTSRISREPTPRIATNASAATIRLAPLFTVPPVAAPSCVSCVRRLSGTSWRSWVSLTHSAAPLAAAFAILIASGGGRRLAEDRHRRLLGLGAERDPVAQALVGDGVRPDVRRRLDLATSGR